MPSHLDCTPFDVLREGSIVEAVRQPPVETLGGMGWFALALAAVLSLAVLAAVLGRRKPTESWVALLAGIAALVAADAVWFEAAASAERIRASPHPTGTEVAREATRVLARGAVGLEVALVTLALVPVARRRMRATEGRPALRAALVAPALLAAVALLAVALDGVAARARAARITERRRRADELEARFQDRRELRADRRTYNVAYMRALVALEERRFDDAERSFAEALVEAPDDPDVLYARALARLDEQHFGDAADDLERVLEIEPERDRVRARLERLEPWRPRR